MTTRRVNAYGRNLSNHAGGNEALFRLDPPGLIQLDQLLGGLKPGISRAGGKVLPCPLTRWWRLYVAPTWRTCAVIRGAGWRVSVNVRADVAHPPAIYGTVRASRRVPISQELKLCSNGETGSLFWARFLC
jgi:hypothetical protein